MAYVVLSNPNILKGGNQDVSGEPGFTEGTTDTSTDTGTSDTGTSSGGADCGQLCRDKKCSSYKKSCKTGCKYCCDSGPNSPSCGGSSGGGAGNSVGCDPCRNGYTHYSGGGCACKAKSSGSTTPKTLSDCPTCSGNNHRTLSAGKCGCAANAPAACANGYVRVSSGCVCNKAAKGCGSGVARVSNGKCVCTSCSSGYHAGGTNNNECIKNASSGGGSQIVKIGSCYSGYSTCPNGYYKQTASFYGQTVQVCCPLQSVLAKAYHARPNMRTKWRFSG